MAAGQKTAKNANYTVSICASTVVQEGLESLALTTHAQTWYVHGDTHTHAQHVYVVLDHRNDCDDCYLTEHSITVAELHNRATLSFEPSSFL